MNTDYEVIPDEAAIISEAVRNAVEAGTDIIFTTGGKNPNALISRSVCAIIGSILVYTLPGSVKAVQEYLQAIFRTVDHMVTMLHGISH